MEEKYFIDFFQKFRRNLQLLRIAKGYSCEEMSIQLGLNGRRIISIESDVNRLPKAEEVFVISKFLGVDAQDMIFKDAQIVFN